MSVEHLGLVAAVKALDEGVLIRLARLNVVDGEPMTGRPVDKRLREKLGAVVDAAPPRECRTRSRAPPAPAPRADSPTAISKLSRLPSSRTVSARPRRRSCSVSDTQSSAPV